MNNKSRLQEANGIIDSFTLNSKNCSQLDAHRIILQDVSNKISNSQNILTLKKNSVGNSDSICGLTCQSTEDKSQEETSQVTTDQFVRKFVEELIDKLPTSDVDTKCKLQSAALSHTVITSELESKPPVTLPDLLQPESVYTKQADTDTDTTEYESAAGSEVITPVDNVSAFEEVLDNEVFNDSLPDASKESEQKILSVNPENAAKYIFSNCYQNSGLSDSPVVTSDSSDFTDNSALKDDDVSSPLNITDLCIHVNRLNLNTSDDVSKIPKYSSINAETFPKSVFLGYKDLKTKDDSINDGDSSGINFHLDSPESEILTNGSSNKEEFSHSKVTEFPEPSLKKENFSDHHHFQTNFSSDYVPKDYDDFIKICKQQESDLELAITSDEATCQNNGDSVFDVKEKLALEAEKVNAEIVNSLNEISKSEVDFLPDRTPSFEFYLGSEMDENISPCISETDISPTQSLNKRKMAVKEQDDTVHRNSGYFNNNETTEYKMSPKSKSRLSVTNVCKDNINYNEIDDPVKAKSRVGNSPMHDVEKLSNQIMNCTGISDSQVEESEVLNLSEAGPEIAETKLRNIEVFQDASTFDFLNSVGSALIRNDLRKESLYVKFDPLVGSALAGECFLSQEQDSVIEITRNVDTSNTPVKEALAVVNKLISLSPSPEKGNEKKSEPTSSVSKQGLPGNESDISSNTSLLSTVIPKNKEAMLNELETLRDMLQKQEEINKTEQEKIRKLEEKVQTQAQTQQKMSVIIEEYEKVLSKLAAEQEKEKQAHNLEKESLLKERDSLVKEKDTVAGHLANTELAFSDVHKKYERSKEIIQTIKNNEQALRLSLAEYQAALKTKEEKYEQLKSHAWEELESANQELTAMKRAHEAEKAKLEAMLKKAEIRISSLEEALDRKDKESQELASICDELISKVGNNA